MKKYLFLAVFILLGVQPAHATTYQTYIISNVVDSSTIVVYDGSDYYLVDTGFGCSFYSSDELEAIYIESSVFGGPSSFGADVVHPDVFGEDTCSVSSSKKLNLKRYYVEDVIDSNDNIILSDNYGYRYIVEYGIGCLSMWRYEDQYIDIDVGGSFLDGIGDTIYLFDSNDDCRVWDAESIGSGTSGSTSYTPIAPVYSCANYGENAYLNTSDDKCYCKAGYEWNSTTTACVAEVICSANAHKDGATCVCNAGYILLDNACVTYDVSCQKSYGPNSYGDGNYCYCDSGFQWNSDQTQCVAEAKVEEPANTPEDNQLSEGNASKTPSMSIDQTNDQFVQGQIDLLKDINTSLVQRLLGRILLQVENHGEAWYHNPLTSKRYYMKDGATAYEMLRAFGLGITDADFEKLNNHNAALVDRLKGRIVLRVESHGEAYYIMPTDGSVNYLKDGDAAYGIMRELSLGISSTDLSHIPIEKFIPIQ